MSDYLFSISVISPGSWQCWLNRNSLVITSWKEKHKIDHSPWNGHLSAAVVDWTITFLVLKIAAQHSLCQLLGRFSELRTSRCLDASSSWGGLSMCSPGPDWVCAAQALHLVLGFLAMEALTMTQDVPIIWASTAGSATTKTNGPHATAHKKRLHWLAGPTEAPGSQLFPRVTSYTPQKCMGLGGSEMPPFKAPMKISHSWAVNYA